MTRRCSYISRGDSGTCLGYGTALAQEGRYVTVQPDDGGKPLRILADYVDFHPLADPQARIPPFIPPAAQTIIDRFALVEESNPNPPSRHGERATHTTATRLWTGRARNVDDAWEWIEYVAELGWRADPHRGDWPCVVECFRVHDPKDDAPQTGRWFRYLRLTYLDGTVQLALYASYRAAKDDAWPAPD